MIELAERARQMSKGWELCVCMWIINKLDKWISDENKIVLGDTNLFVNVLGIVSMCHLYIVFLYNRKGRKGLSSAQVDES